MTNAKRPRAKHNLEQITGAAHRSKPLVSSLAKDEAQSTLRVLKNVQTSRDAREASSFSEHVVREFDKESERLGAQTLYRGLAGDHVRLKYARRGIVVPGKPHGGHVDDARHNHGDTHESQFTSWTDKKHIAQAVGGGGQGLDTLLMTRTAAPNPGDTWYWVASFDDVYCEQERLLAGIRREGVKPVRVQSGHTEPVFSFDSNEPVGEWANRVSTVANAQRGQEAKANLNSPVGKDKKDGESDS